MRNIFIGFFIFFSLASIRSFGATQSEYDNYQCSDTAKYPSDGTWVTIQTVIQAFANTWTRAQVVAWADNKYTILYNTFPDFRRVSNVPTVAATSTYANASSNNWEIKLKSKEDNCILKPVCVSPKVLDETVNPPVCRIICDQNQTEQPDGTCKNNPCTDDIDCDGIPDNADDDIDGDGIPNASDDDIDGDGIPNASDDDIDGDGIPNASDDNSGNGCGIGRTYNNASETCSCSNGYPETYNYSTNNWECQVPKCSPYDGILPLYGQNVSRSYCASLSNSALGFTSSYHTTDGLSCCYSDTVKAQDDDCPTNSIRDKNGICQSIGINEPNTDLNNSVPTNPYNPPPSDSTPTTQNPDGTYTESGSGETTDPTGNCLPNYIWDNQKQKCLLFLPSTNDGNFTGILDGNGTVTDTNDTNFTNQATSDGGQVESYKPGEFDGVIDNMFKAENKKQKDFIESQGDVVRGLFGQYFAVDLPDFNGGSCACEDYTMNVAIAGKSYIKKFTICEYLDEILTAFKYVLRFFVMYLIILRIREIV